MKSIVRGKRKSRRWVVKVGSNIVCHGGPLLMRAWMQQIAILRRKYGIEVVWVSSGAIASAVERTQFKKRKRELAEKQALSAIGQPLLMDLYNLSLQAVGLIGSQILLTYHDLKDKERRRNLQHTIEKLLEWGVVPILNENDTVATEEIKFGDNDSLSAKVACAMNADRLIIMTDVDGLFDSNPKTNRTAKLLSHIKQVTPKLLSMTSTDSGSSRGTGGMYSKLKAAKEATSFGIETFLVKGDLAQVLIRIAEEEPVGTRVAPQ